MGFNSSKKMIFYKRFKNHWTSNYSNYRKKPDAFSQKNDIHFVISTDDAKFYEP